MKENNNDDQSEEEQIISEKENESNPMIKEIENGDQKIEDLMMEKDGRFPFISKFSSDSLINPDEEAEIKAKERAKEIHKSFLYNIKDYLFFFFLMISSSMNFSYLYYPLTIMGMILYFLIGKNTKSTKFIKLILELIAVAHSSILLLIKIVCLVLIINDNEFIHKRKSAFLNLGICYLREDGSSFYFIMTFLGESLVILLSIYSIIISRKYRNFTIENDTALMKNTFWTSRKLIILNFICVLSFAAFNQSFLTLFYMLMLQILFLLSSIHINTDNLDYLSNLAFIILKYCILVQIGLINILNVPIFQDNVLNKEEIMDKEGNIKVFSIFTKIGINYAYNIKISYIWKEWIGYLAAVLSLISLSYSINNIKLKDFDLIRKVSSISILEAKALLNEENEENTKNNPEKKLIVLKKKVSKGISSVKKMLGIIIDFLTSPVFIIQLGRIGSIFYIYFYSNFYSIGIFITLFFSSIFIDVN